MSKTLKTVRVTRLATGDEVVINADQFNEQEYELVNAGDAPLVADVAARISAIEDVEESALAAMELSSETGRLMNPINQREQNRRDVLRHRD